MNGVWRTTRERLMQRPREQYQALSAQLAVGNNPEAGHFAEWAAAALYGGVLTPPQTLARRVMVSTCHEAAARMSAEGSPLIAEAGLPRAQRVSGNTGSGKPLPTNLQLHVCLSSLRTVPWRLAASIEAACRVYPRAFIRVHSSLTPALPGELACHLDRLRSVCNISVEPFDLRRELRASRQVG